MHTIHANLTHDEFLRIARQEIDTPGVADVLPIVAELFTRFEHMAASANAIEEIFSRFDFDNVEQVIDVLDALHDINPDFDMPLLTEKVKRSDAVWDVAQDCGDTLDRLHQIVKTCL